MAIICWPDGTNYTSSVPCVICQEKIALAQATAGLWYENGHQAFACDDHFWSGSQLVSGWVNFILAQRSQRQLQTASDSPNYEGAV